MTAFEFALTLETGLLHETKELMQNFSQDNKSLIEAVYESQKNFENLITAATHSQIDTFAMPTVDLSLLGEERLWQSTTSQQANTVLSMENLILCWKLYILTEKATQFYQQAALNSPHPKEKLFFTSCAEVRNILKRRIQGILQIIYNQVWAEIGFNPISLGKE